MKEYQILDEAPSGAQLRLEPIDIAVRTIIVGLTLATGYIHSTLGGLLFTLNGAGYAVAAVAMVLPLALAIRFRWVVRLGLIGYAAVTIVGWYLTGPRYETAYISKAIELVLIAVLAVDFVRHDGNPLGVIRRKLAAPHRRAGAARS